MNGEKITKPKMIMNRSSNIERVGNECHPKMGKQQQQIETSMAMREHEISFHFWWLTIRKFKQRYVNGKTEWWDSLT